MNVCEADLEVLGFLMKDTHRHTNAVDCLD